MNKLEELMQNLGYQFADKNLLEMALTHRSLRGSNNERLEYLGDSALNFIIAFALYQRFAKAREGELSRLRSNLVKGETLALLAQELHLSDYIRLGMGEKKAGGAQRESILADAMEAIIGAIFLDGGFQVACEQVLRWYQKRLETISIKNLKDPKTQLQEYLQSEKLPLPEYTIVDIQGEAHAQTFFIECRVAGLQHVAKGSNKSRRKAEQDAAKNMLMMMQK